MNKARLIGKVLDWFAGQDSRTYRLEHSQLVVYNVHRRALCYGRPCPIHRRTDHVMRAWPQHWRGDRGLVERICPHGVGHPDPDQYEWWFSTGQEYMAIHGCDGCGHSVVSNPERRSS